MLRNIRIRFLKESILAGIAIIFLTSCGNDVSPKPTDGVEELIGAGATFPFPLYSKMFYEYYKSTGIKINYQSIGSGGGIRQLQNKTVDFGATDTPLNDEDIAKSEPILHFPTCVGAVIITYNLPGNPKLKFTSDVLADIFLGKITKWNDKRITELNEDAPLPDMDISVIHRSDGSGTTYIFSDYLSKVSSIWRIKPGKGKSLDWPVGLGAKGNEGVGGLVMQTPGSIGYTELAYVVYNHLQAAQLENKSGNFIEASLASISAAANVNVPEDFRVSLTNTEVPDGYPISCFTYLLVYKNQSYDDRTKAQAKGLVDLINWMIHDGQKFTQPLMYAPLPTSIVQSEEKELERIMFNNNPI